MGGFVFSLCALVWFFIFFPGFPTGQEETNIATRTSISKSWICRVWCGVIFCYAIDTLKRKGETDLRVHMYVGGRHWSWSYGSWIYNYLYMQSVPISPLTMWVLIFSGEVYSIQHYVIKFVSDLQRQVCGFLWELRIPPPIKLTSTT